MNVTLDKWDIGTIPKDPVWATYIIFNFSGVAFCLYHLYHIKQLRDRNSFDVLVGNLFLACVWMSLTCGGQCLVSVIHGVFFGGELACTLEAFFHISAILAQFFSVGLLSIRNCYSVMAGKSMQIEIAYAMAIGLWAVCISVTYGLSYVSEIYLMDTGTFCFFAFSSPAIALWLLPGLTVAALTMAVTSVIIYHKLRKHELNMPAPSVGESRLTERTARRCIWYITVLLIGWLPAAIATCYELSTGRTPEALVTAVGVFGTLHTILVAVVYTMRRVTHTSGITVSVNTTSSGKQPSIAYVPSPSPRTSMPKMLDCQVIRVSPKTETHTLSSDDTVERILDSHSIT